MRARHEGCTLQTSLEPPWVGRQVSLTAEAPACAPEALLWAHKLKGLPQQRVEGLGGTARGGAVRAADKQGRKGRMEGFDDPGGAQDGGSRGQRRKEEGGRGGPGQV